MNDTFQKMVSIPNVAVNYTEKQAEIREYISGREGNWIRQTIGYLHERHFVNSEANERRLRLAGDLQGIPDILGKIFENQPVDESDVQKLHQVPKLLREASTIMKEWSYPYFASSRLGIGTVAELRAQYETDWTPERNQANYAAEWSNMVDFLKEASESYVGRIQGKPVVSTLAASV